MFKYFDIFKKVLSGGIDKKLFSLDYNSGTDEDLLQSLVRTGLNDNELLNHYYDKIINELSLCGKYYIVLGYCTYDVPQKASDGTTLEDGENSHSYVMCAICPVERSKPGLGYNEDEKQIKDRIRDNVVQTPVFGYTYPAFTDRETDLHSIIVFKKDKTPYEEQILGIERKLTSEEQRDCFYKSLNELVDNNGVKNGVIEEISTQVSLHECATQKEVNEEKVELTQSDIEKLLSDRDINVKDHMDVVQKLTDAKLSPEALIDKKISVKVGNIEIKGDSEDMDRLIERTIDGRTYICIAKSL